MKNSIQLNVGLTTSNNNPVEIHRLLQDLRAAGLYAANSRIALGYWRGQPECTLVAECLFAIPLCHPEARLAIRVSLARIAEQHGQTCVAVLWPDSTGELVPNVGEFDTNQFRPVHAPENTPACDCVANVIDALKHCATVSADNHDKYGEQEFNTCGAFLTSRADNLRAVIYPASAPARNPEITSGW